MIFLLIWQVLVTILCATTGLLAASSGEEVLIIFLFWIFLCNLPFFFGFFND